jgi:hypothetical protein
MMPINVNPLNTPSTTTTPSSTTAPEYTPIAYTDSGSDTYSPNTTTYPYSSETKALPPVPDFARNYSLLVEFFGRLFKIPCWAIYLPAYFKGY